jgi:transcriptional regulator with XRE-family HTH domain
MATAEKAAPVADSAKADIRLRGEKIGQVIRRWMADMSYGELSEKTGIDKGALQRYATGERGISSDHLCAIADVLSPNSPMVMVRQVFEAAFENMSSSDGGRLYLGVLDSIS